MANISDRMLADKTLEAVKAAEKRLDAEIQRLDNLEEDDLETLRKKRVQVRHSFPSLQLGME